MNRIAIGVLAAAASTSALAEGPGPGSRIGTTPDVTLPRQPVASELVKRCDALRGEERERCLTKARSAAPSGPESTGMASGPAAAGQGSSGAAAASPAMRH